MKQSARLMTVCAALLCGAPSAFAQVSFERRDPADERVVEPLSQLIGEEVAVVDAARANVQGVARVWIDRDLGVLRVTSRDNPAGLSRPFDPAVLARAPYAVALAAAEMLDLLRVTSKARGTESVPAPTPAPTSRAIISTPASETVAREAPLAPPPPPPREPDLPAEEARPTNDDAAKTLAEREPEPEVESRAVATPHDSRASRRSGLLGFAIGVDLELQTQPGHTLSFLRPALYGELAWGRATPGWFWTAGARVSAPFSRELQPLAAAQDTDSSLRAQAMDVAVLGGAGYSFGLLGVAAHVTAGAAYTRVDALDPAGRVLGHDAYVSPLLAAGLGARLPVVLGLALAVSGEAQWAGPKTTYRIEGASALVAGSARLSFLAGILWESSLSSAGL